MSVLDHAVSRLGTGLAVFASCIACASIFDIEEPTHRATGGTAGSLSGSGGLSGGTGGNSGVGGDGTQTSGGTGGSGGMSSGGICPSGSFDSDGNPQTACVAWL